MKTSNLYFPLREKNHLQFHSNIYEKLGTEEGVKGGILNLLPKHLALCL